MFTPVAIGVAAGLGTLIVSFFLIRFYLWIRRRRNTTPLPPVQMLAHQRLQQQEIYLSQANYAADLQALSPTEDAGPFGSVSSTALPAADRYPNPNPNPNPNAAGRSGASESIPPSCSSSRAALVPSEEQLGSRPPSRSTNHVLHSARSSFSSTPSIRGPPHKRLSRPDIVFPPPLATSEQSTRRSQCQSLYDQWAPPPDRPASKANLDVIDTATTDSPPRYSAELPNVPSAAQSNE